MTTVDAYSVWLVRPPQQDALAAALAGAGFALTQSAELGAAGAADAVLWPAATPQALAALMQHGALVPTGLDTAVVVLTAAGDAGMAMLTPQAEATLLGLGVEAIVAADDAQLPRALRHAILRKRHQRLARQAYATDLATGLPHQAQLLEHMTQLLALREREPATMVLLVLRITGYAAVAARLGAEAANVLRRKVAVRLRSGLRAGDVVAAISADAFGVLLGHLEAPADGERVAAKLVRMLQQPLVVAGEPCPVTVAVGMALYPAHGKDASTLLRRASAQAASLATLGPQGFAAPTERGPGAAANDDGA